MLYRISQFIYHLNLNFKENIHTKFSERKIQKKNCAAAYIYNYMTEINTLENIFSAKPSRTIFAVQNIFDRTERQKFSFYDKNI